jgi:hypothetical protein
LRVTFAEELCVVPCTIAPAPIVSCVALGAWFEGAFNVKIENCPAVICGGWKLAVTPDGTPETLRAASCVKPFELVSDT